jgi:hypothetical protein
LARASAIVIAFVAAAGFRFLGLRNGFPNDHFVHLVGAQQILLGDWPTRDFVDPGLPFMFALSAAAERVLGSTLLAEGVLVALAFGAGAAFTVAAVTRLTGSALLGLLAAAFEVAVFPRTYGYPKILIYATTIWLFGRYAARPSATWRWAIVALVGVAFLFRHDHGLFVFAGGLLAVLLAPADGAGVRRSLTFAAASIAVVLPYLLFVQVQTGLWPYLRTGIEFSQREAAREGHVWPNPFLPGAHEARLLYAFHLMPLAALAVLVLRRRAPKALQLVAQVLPIVGVALLVNAAFLRDPLSTRLPDAVVPAVILGTWLVAQAWRAPRARWLTVGFAAIVVLAMGRSTLAVGHTAEEVDRAGLMTGYRRIPERFRERRAQLTDRFSESQIPTAAVQKLIPFFRYLARCTAPDDRILNLGYLPEAPVFARRGFAGGLSFFGAYPSSDERERLVLERIGRQVVPFAILASDFTAEFDQRFPHVAAHVRARYREVADLEVRDDLHLRILVDTTLAAPTRDAETGFPCFDFARRASTQRP